MKLRILNQTNNTPNPRATWFPLARFPLTRTLAYVRASWGFSHNVRNLCMYIIWTSFHTNYQHNDLILQIRAHPEPTQFTLPTQLLRRYRTSQDDNTFRMVYGSCFDNTGSLWLFKSPFTYLGVPQYSAGHSLLVCCLGLCCLVNCGIHPSAKLGHRLLSFTNKLV